MGHPKSLSSRVSVIDDEVGGFRVTIARPPLRLGLVWLPIWLVFWGIFEVQGIRAMITGVPPGKEGTSGIGQALFFAVWTMGGLGFGSFFVWSLFGREVLAIEGTSLVHRYEVGGLGRGRRFDLAEVRNLRYDPPSGWGRGLHQQGRVAFDHDRGTRYLGEMLEEAECLFVIDLLNGHLKPPPPPPT